VENVELKSLTPDNFETVMTKAIEICSTGKKVTGQKKAELEVVALPPEALEGLQELAQLGWDETL
jgi:hypothetical protein